MFIIVSNIFLYTCAYLQAVYYCNKFLDFYRFLITGESVCDGTFFRRNFGLIARCRIWLVHFMVCIYIYYDNRTMHKKLDIYWNGFRRYKKAINIIKWLYRLRLSKAYIVHIGFRYKVCKKSLTVRCTVTVRWLTNRSMHNLES